MPCRVTVAPHVLDALRGVEVPITDDFQEQLALLAERPRLGTPQTEGPFEGLFAHECRITRLPVSRLFQIVYAYDPKEQAIEVLGFGVKLGGPLMRLGPPRFRKT